MKILQSGLILYENILSYRQQKELVQILYANAYNNPFFKAVSPRKKAMGSLMTNMGELGWYTDIANGYRYISHHPETKQLWPPIPAKVMDIWHKFADYTIKPHCCLINYYNKENRNLGMHKDIDEEDFIAPILSISLGDTCKFRYSANSKKPSPSKTTMLKSGAILVMKGESRLLYHSVDKIFFGSSALLGDNFGSGRLNLTLRVVRNERF